MKTIMEMARECDLIAGNAEHGIYIMALERFAELVRADEAEKFKWDIHSCGPTCTKVGCVAVREAVLAEREACAMVCDELPAPPYVSRNDATVWDVATLECGDSIRARGQA